MPKSSFSLFISGKCVKSAASLILEWVLDAILHLFKGVEFVAAILAQVAKISKLSDEKFVVRVRVKALKFSLSHGSLFRKLGDLHVARFKRAICHDGLVVVVGDVLSPGCRELLVLIEPTGLVHSWVMVRRRAKYIGRSMSAMMILFSIVGSDRGSEEGSGEFRKHFVVFFYRLLL